MSSTPMGSSTTGGLMGGEMTSLRLIRHKMLEMAPEFGSVEVPSAFAAQTATVARLATGTISAQKYRDFWILRPDTATAADRPARIITNFNSTTGVLTHAGAAYSDTTATGEVIELWKIDPQRADRAIAYAVGTMRVLDTDYMPTVPHREEYDLSPFTWIQEEDDLLGIGYRASPVLSRNRGFDKWADAYTPELDHWALSGSGATLARTTGVPTGRYGAMINRAGTNAVLSQTIGLHDTGVAADSLKGQRLILVCYGRTTTASQLRASVTDGTQTVTTSYHTGGGGYEELSDDITVATTATELTISVQVNTTDGAAIVDQCYLVRADAINDSIRRDIYPVAHLNRDEWQHGESRWSVKLPVRGRGGQYVVYSARPVPTFDATKIAAGTADGDDVDVPVDTAAIGALARLYRGLASRQDENTKRHNELAGYWEAQRQQAQAKLLALPGRPARDFGLRFTPPMMAPVPVR